MSHAVVIATFCIFALQNPAPSRVTRDDNQPGQLPESTQAKPDILIGAERAPTVIRIAKTSDEAKQEQEDRDRDATTQRWTIVQTVANAVLTLSLVAVGFAQWRTYGRQTHILDAQRHISRDALAANTVVERAYVKISHEWRSGAASPLEFTLSEGQPARAHVWVSITVKNEGHTPADVLGGGLWPRVTEDGQIGRASCRERV